MAGAFPENRPGVPLPATTASPIADPAEARAWLDAERANLVAATSYAAEHGWDDHARDLTATLWLYLVAGPHYTDAITTNTHSLRSARARGDRATEANALTNLGSVHWRTGRPGEAMEYLERALLIRRTTGDHAGEGWTLNNLASVYWSCGRYQQFLDHC
jgi:tetratricopeptide (TPR) repeat protein